MCPHYFIKQNKKELYCPICEIFGSPWKESSLFFSDLLWEANDWKGINTGIRPGIAISRRRGVATEQKLFFVETSSPGALPEFRGNITVKLRDEKQIALLILGLNSIRGLGGGKSRGMGWCRIDIDSDTMSKEEIIKAMKEWKNGEN